MPLAMVGSGKVILIYIGSGEGKQVNKMQGTLNKSDETDVILELFAKVNSSNRRQRLLPN